MNMRLLRGLSPLLYPTGIVGLLIFIRNFIGRLHDRVSCANMSADAESDEDGNEKGQD